jgi:acyl carrier protein
MTKVDIFTKIQERVSDLLGIDAQEIEFESDFRNDLGCDSLMMAELIMEFEHKFGMLIPDDEAEGLSTVSSVVDYVHGRLAEV